LHGQHEHQALLDPLAHLPLLDDYANAGQLAAEVATVWTRLRSLRDELERSHMDERERSARLDLIGFQLGEIEKGAPKPGEDDELAATKQVLASAERIQRLCEESYATLYDRDDAVLAGLGGVWKRVGELATIDPQFTPFVESRDGIKSQLEDLAFFLRTYADGIDASPARLQEVEDRLALMDRLKRKYGPTLQDVIDRRQALARERELLTGVGEGADDLVKRLETATAEYLAKARELSRRRRTAAVRFARDMEGLLDELAMARTRFEVRFNEGELGESGWSERGIDNAEFFVSPNPGEELRPLARIVSGGELSRVMLALKTLANTKPGSMFDPNPTASKTLIFDEVDAGIGGRVADVVGSRLQDLGRRFQVLCITHLPQIAARGDAQFLIEKSIRGNRTVTRVERLDPSGRVEEMARMIGGASITDQTRTSARELLAAGKEARSAQSEAWLDETRSAKSGERRKAKAKARG
jgi:DNA repair protein RecN (Recombination protein N)